MRCGNGFKDNAGNPALAPLKSPEFLGEVGWCEFLGGKPTFRLSSITGSDLADADPEDRRDAWRETRYGHYWLASPDLVVTDESGNTFLLSDYRRKSAILLLLFFLYAKERGARDGAVRTAVGRPRTAGRAWCPDHPGGARQDL